ncbi:MAG: hypothetical protein V3V16_01500 [Melioribacteraceae bacterium]
MMKTKTKTTLVILSTLIIGIILGFLLHANITRMRFEQMGELRKPGGLMKKMESIIDLTEEQKNRIEPILTKHENRFKIFIGQVMGHLMSLREDVKQHLTEKQIEELEKYFKNRGDFLPPHGFRPGPPRDG